MLTAALCLIGLLSILNVVQAVLYVRSYERFMVRTLAYTKAATAAEAESALREPTPPAAPAKSGEELLDEAQKKAYA